MISANIHDSITAICGGRLLERKPTSDPDGRGRRKSPDSSKNGKERPGARGSSRLAAAQQSIGTFLRATRTAQKLTQEQVAAMTRDTPWHLSRAAISAIERGQNFPGMEAMLALSNVLYVDPKELIERARLSTTVPVDVTDLSLEQLGRRAARYFWSGDFRKALSVYDAMLEKLALDPPADVGRELANLEIRRATTLKRAGALLSAIATAERAISLSAEIPQVHAEAYILLADLQCQRGHLPLAGDAAKKAIELSRTLDPRTQGWAWMTEAHVRFLSADYQQARNAFLEARKQATAAGDEQHLTHIDGDVGMCLLALGQVAEARTWVARAVERARKQSQPALEASWLVELGKIALRQRNFEEAERFASSALRIARPREHVVTIFRAEWLQHNIARSTRPDDPDRLRIARLRKLYLHLDQHEGIEEVQVFKRTIMRKSAIEYGESR
ncbi:MAG TPA: helix-turn-helix transcriptional regulator [Candidatus Polarisedimenticolaceae bacterium]|nr:helix-turn-helix transcriptional regulator [Candidatus Polarisedimenticolaceae bacterium]